MALQPGKFLFFGQKLTGLADSPDFFLALTKFFEQFLIYCLMLDKFLSKNLTDLLFQLSHETEVQLDP